jgi:hypothetical protein
MFSNCDNGKHDLTMGEAVKNWKFSANQRHLKLKTGSEGRGVSLTIQDKVAVAGSRHKGSALVTVQNKNRNVPYESGNVRELFRIIEFYGRRDRVGLLPGSSAAVGASLRASSASLSTMDATPVISNRSSLRDKVKASLDEESQDLPEMLRKYADFLETKNSTQSQS